MVSSCWLAIPFILQMLCISADEFWFHRKRGLPKWERIGHPLDTLTVLLCLGWILWLEPTSRTAAGFILLALFSCLFVTKDEPVHRKCCSTPEQWLHALLFMLHPLTLASLALLWPALHGISLPQPWVIRYSGFEKTFVAVNLALMAGFGLYQFGYWNLKWRKQRSQP